MLTPQIRMYNWYKFLAEEIGATTGLSEPSFPLATLPDLPNELLLIVIRELDNESLFNLGLTCQRMNTIALNHFFSKNNIQDPARGYFLPESCDLPIQTIPALRSALFVHHLRSFDFVLNPGAKNMRDEVADLFVLAARLHSIKTFKLSFRHIDDQSFHFKGILVLDAANDIMTWYKSVTGLLDNVLDKSCDNLHVEGGYRFHDLYRDLLMTHYGPSLGPLGIFPLSMFSPVISFDTSLIRRHR